MELKALIDIRNIWPKSEGKEFPYEEVYDEAEEEINDYLNGRIEINRPLKTLACQYDNAVIVGRDNPKGIREIVESWNSRILCNLKDSLSKFEICAEREGLDGIFGVIEAGKAKKVMGDFCFSYEMQKLQRVINAVNNQFQYGHDSIAMFHFTGHCYRKCFLYLPEYFVQDAMEHPENFAVVTFEYD